MGFQQLEKAYIGRGIHYLLSLISSRGSVLYTGKEREVVEVLKKLHPCARIVLAKQLPKGGQFDIIFLNQNIFDETDKKTLLEVLYKRLNYPGIFLFESKQKAKDFKSLKDFFEIKKIKPTIYLGKKKFK